VPLARLVAFNSSARSRRADAVAVRVPVTVWLRKQLLNIFSATLAEWAESGELLSGAAAVN